jgi:hypothetical protein
LQQAGLVSHSNNPESSPAIKEPHVEASKRPLPEHFIKGKQAC